MPDGAPYQPPRLHRPPVAGSGLSELLRIPPGGAALTAAWLVGLARREGRRWGLLALFFWLGGPGVPLLLRNLGVPGAGVNGPLNYLLSALPLTEALGNPTRMLAAWALPAAIAAGLSARRWWAWAPLAALVALEAARSLPLLALPATPTELEEEVLAALEGPTTIFPAGDAPLLSPAVSPKEAHFLAGQAGVPIGLDYGRGRPPADLALHLALVRAANIPVGRAALRMESRGMARWDVVFESLLLLEGRLPPEARAGARAWLIAAGAEETERGRGTSAWRLGEEFFRRQGAAAAPR